MAWHWMTRHDMGIGWHEKYGKKDMTWVLEHGAWPNDPFCGHLWLNEVMDSWRWPYGLEKMWYPHIVHKDLEKEIKDNKVTWKSKVKQASMTKMRGHGKTSNKWLALMARRTRWTRKIKDITLTRIWKTMENMVKMMI